MNEHEEAPAPAAEDTAATTSIVVDEPVAVPQTKIKKPRIATPIVAFCLAFSWLLGTSLVVGVLVAMMLAVAGRITNPPGPGVEQLIAAELARPFWMCVLLPVSAFGSFVVALGGAAFSPTPWRARLRLGPSTWERAAVGTVLGTLLVQSLGQTTILILYSITDERSSSLRALAQAMAAAPLSQFVFLLVVGGVIAPIGEELLFRGYLQTRFTQRFGPAVGIVVTSILFGVLHMNLLHSIATVVMGLCLGLVTERAGSIRPAIVAHVVNNTVAFLLVRLEGGADDETIAWWAVLLSVGISAVVVVAMRLYLKSQPPPPSAPVA